MVYRLTVVEDAGGKQVPIRGASVRFIDSSGGVLKSMTTDAQGAVYVDDTRDGRLLFSGVAVSVTAKGFFETRFPSESLETDHLAFLQPRPNVMLYALIGAAGMAALLLFTSSGYKK